MSLPLVIAGLVACELLFVLVALGLARSAARADARARREIEDWYEQSQPPHPLAAVKPDRSATPYPGVRERPASSGARAAGARPRPQR
jgi:hypothetical protein